MPWIDAYRSYDDDTLAALASTGLLRRAAKDVEAGRVQWLEQGDSTGVVQSDGQRVRLDARGPQQARCDCPAPAMCKHILGAALWLRGLPASAPATVPAGAAEDEHDTAHPIVPGPHEPQPGDPLAEVMALASTALFKAAGIAAVRRAAQALPCGVEWRVQAGTLIIDLPDLGATCRWIVHAGFEGMVSEVPTHERKAVHLMALAALRLAQGQPLAWPEGMAAGAAAHTGTPPTTPLSQRESVFVGQVEALLHELLTGGLSHVSEQASGRLLALNMSARGEGLPRLAALLRNLGGMVDWLVRRDHRALERDALALMAHIQALCDALRAEPPTDTREPGALAAALRGRTRREFGSTDTLDLLPLGGYWWQTLGGARGLTLGFWEVGAQRLLQATLARPDASDLGFNRHSAWNTHAVWPGAGAAHQLCLAPLRLEQPRLADDDRLALAGNARAQAQPAWRADDPRLAHLGCSLWSALTDRLAAATGLTGDALDTLVLRPAATQPPRIDEARQELHWPVQDEVGEWLRLTVPVSEPTAQRIDNLERLCARGAAVHAVVVRIERTGSATLLVPVAVLSTTPQGTVAPVSLDFAAEPARPSPMAERILRMLQLRREQRMAPATTAPTLSMRLLAPVLDVLDTQAATGRVALTSAQRAQQPQALPAIASVGLRSVEAALLQHCTASSAASILRLHCLCQWTLELDGLPTAALS